MTVNISHPFSVKWVRLVTLFYYNARVISCIGCVYSRSGPRTASTADVPGRKGKYAWNEAKPLVLVCTLYQDRKTLRFQKKTSQIVVKQTSGKSTTYVVAIRCAIFVLKKISHLCCLFVCYHAYRMAWETDNCRFYSCGDGGARFGRIC